MKTFSIGEALSVGWKRFMQRPWYLLGLTLAFGALFILGSMNNSLIPVVGYIIYVGYLVVIFKLHTGEKIEFDDLFTPDSRWVYFIFASIIKWSLITLALLVFIIPGVYLAIRWMFVEFLVVDKGLKPIVALRASSALTKGHRWHLFWFSLVASLLLVLGFLLFVIGSVVASIVVSVALVHVYRALQAAPPTTPPPQSHS